MCLVHLDRVAHERWSTVCPDLGVSVPEPVRQDDRVRADEAIGAAMQAAHRGGLVVDGAWVLRVGENGVVVLPGAGALARVVRDQKQLAQVQHEMAVAQWLASVAVPVAAPLLPSPTLVDGYVVSFWEYLPDAASADLVTLARCLRRLHAVSPPESGLLTGVDPFTRFDERLAGGVTLSEEDRAFLTTYRDELATQWNRSRFELGQAVVHGDAHMDNLLRTADGRLAFVDLETVAIGPPEWDLTLTALYYECGWFSADDYTAFADAYGYDVRRSRAWPVLRGIRMLRMTTWLAQSAGDHSDRELQLRHRIATLRDGTAPDGWTGF